ncbi:MAG: hypothetical protein ACPG8W_13980 [Candidatus Promineifilaceae bacterium]
MAEQGSLRVQRDPNQSIRSDRANHTSPISGNPFIQRGEEDVEPVNCRVEVRYSRLGGLPFIGDWYHAYVLVTMADGKRYYVRGGPESGAGSSGSTSAISGGSSQNSSGGSSGSSGSGSSNSSNSSNPGSSPAEDGGSTGPFGKIVTEYGEYVPGTIDYETGSPPTVVVHVSANGDECTTYYDAMKSSADRIEGANIPYNPLSQNSNSTAHQAVEDAGLSRPSAPVWAPGSDRRI